MIPALVSSLLEFATHQLSATGIATARLDTLVLLEDISQKDRSYLLAHPEMKLTEIQCKKFIDQVARRAKHEPLAYIRGKTEFYGREFKVNKHVLEPRPESEAMIDILKRLPLPDSPHIVDVGTGSGALGITAVLELPGSTVDLIDIDQRCLSVARQNLKLRNVTAGLYKADLLQTPVRFRPDILLVNLPYVPDNFTINDSALQEPKIAIFGGADGLDLYRRLFLQIATLLQFDSRKPQYILTESLPFQHEGLTKIAKQAEYKLRCSEDFIQVFES